MKKRFFSVLKKCLDFGRTCSTYLAGQCGSAAVIAALSMAALLGFSSLVLDLGLSYHEAARLQNALDSAVLAAVSELPADSLFSAGWAAAQGQAVRFAAANGVSLAGDELEPVYPEGLSSGRIIGIRATKSIAVNYSFARVFGIGQGLLTRTAAAGIVPAGAVTGAVPLSITSSALQAAIDAGAVAGLTIKCSSNTGQIGIDCTGLSGWFGALRFDGGGASTYSALLAYGYSGTLRIGQVLDVENGNMSGPTLEGCRIRCDACVHGCTAGFYEPNCPRVILIPVVEIISNNQVRVVSFACFFLDEYGGSGNDSYIKATYLSDVVLPAAAAGTSGEDFGVYVGRLLS